ncbi:MAG TPA: hypothetical protein VG323_10990, partial [Thermoanaerobaculia bacterium]|nr:hypothetical protein [Thermoanaerobaculia bacterium]
MSPNRKADLQRKLAMAPIPKPPAGLAERIKSDIPQHLLVDVRKERERLSTSIVFNLRVAASILLLVGSAYLALHMLTRAEIERTTKELPSNVVVARKEAPKPAASARVAETAEAAPAPVVEVPRGVPEAKAEKKTDVAVAKPVLQRGREEAPASAAPRPAADFAPPPPAPVPPQQPAMADEAVSVGAAAPRAAAKVTGGLMAEAQGAPLALAPATLFDIDVAHDALIQHYAAPAAPPSELHLEAETVVLDGTPLLRVSVDAPKGRLPVAADAKLNVDFDDGAVVAHRALAGTTTSTASAVPPRASVTALFTFEPKPNLGRRATIATVTLRYRSVDDGQEHVITRKVRGVGSWGSASKRMKSTALAAALEDSLTSPSSIAEKARAAGLDELTTRARERVV